MNLFQQLKNFVLFIINSRSSIKWICSLFVVGFIIFIATITFQVIMVKSYRNQEDSNDELYNPLVPASISGIIVFIYFLLLSGLVLWTINAPTKWPTVAFFFITLFGCFVLDTALVFWYPLRIATKCSITDFDGIMRNCRREFSDLLMVIRQGSTPVMIGIAGVLHAILLAFAAAVSIHGLCLRPRKNKYEVNGRGNGFRPPSEHIEMS